LHRITELVPLGADPRIWAVESEDAFNVCRALVWGRVIRRLPAHREALEMLLRNRRLFARPLNQTVFLGMTLNGSFFAKTEAK